MFDHINTINSQIRYDGTEFRFYTFRVYCVQDSSLDFNTWKYNEKNELSVGINNRLCSIHSGIRIRTEELSQKYLKLNLPKWKAKWGEDVNIQVVVGSTSGRKTFFKVLEHTDIVLNRLKM